MSPAKRVKPPTPAPRARKPAAPKTVKPPTPAKRSAPPAARKAPAKRAPAAPARTVPEGDRQELKLRRVYAELATSPGSWVPLERIRAKFPHLPREKQDAALRALSRRPDAFLTPDSDQRRLTPARRAAAIKIGAEDRHYLMIQK